MDPSVLEIFCMNLSFPLTAVAASALLTPFASAVVSDGNGLGSAYITHDATAVGSVVGIDFGSPAAPNGLVILSVSDGIGPVNHPLLGTICFDVFSPAYFILTFVADATGNKHLDFSLSNNPVLAQLPPLYINGFALEPGASAGDPPVFSLSRTTRIQFMLEDSYTAVTPMTQARALHSATALNADPKDEDVRVFVAGGHTNFFMQPDSVKSTELFHEISHDFSPGPDLNFERSGHQAQLLDDGRVLLIGGTGVGGVGLDSCEIFDPATNTISLAAPMSTPRLAFASSKLPDGRVLVSGGYVDFSNALFDFISTMNGAQDTAEIYDPVTDTWTVLVQEMASKRAGHAQVSLPSGDILIISGTNGGTTGQFGGAFPTWTSSCEIYNLATGTLFPTTSLIPGRAGFGASVLGNGDVLLSGGTRAGGGYGEAIASNTCLVFDGASWSSTAPLTQAIAFHTQVASADGGALIHGGMIGDLSTLVSTSVAGKHDGVSYTPLSLIGSNPAVPAQADVARGTHTMTELFDGSFLILGGASSLDAFTPLNFKDGYRFIAP